MKLQISLIAVLIILTFISCQHSQSQDSNMAGSYAYKKPSMMEGTMMMLRGKTKQLVSPKLNLEENNTFSFSTCGCSTEGVWKSGKDTILLQHHVVNYQEGISKCYLPETYTKYGRNKLLGRNKDEYIEILTRKE